MSGKEDEYAVFFLHHVRIGQRIAEQRENILARGLLVQQQEYMIGLELIFLHQHVAHCLSVIGGIAQPGPLVVAVHADDRSPAFAIRRLCSFWQAHLLHSTGVRDRKSGSVPRSKAVTIFLQGLNQRGQHFDGAVVNIMKEDDAASLLIDFLQDALSN